MAPQTTVLRSPHDQGVEREAQELQRAGWNVQADIRGWSNPPLIAGRQPDVYARKNGHTRIIEVETSADDDRDQHTTFRRHAAQKDRTTFIVVVVDRAGRRVARFDGGP